MLTKFRVHILMAVVIMTFGLFLVPVKDAGAVSAADWKAGNIIDDGIFYSGTDMSWGDIQTFLNSKVPSCDTWGTKPSEHGGGSRAQYGASRGYPAPYTCLRDYSQNIPGYGADSYCSSIGAGNKSAAQIIKEVSMACGVGSKVLLVLLQKEQSLVTDDWPFPTQYQKATGFACPDTAPCDSQYAGFFNQVYRAARQYKVYRANAGSYRYKSGQNNAILWNVESTGCGSGTVFIENSATAGLYIYTPYQPNQAALNNMYGTGDGCSAYGNRNFWRMYSDWFGSTRYTVPYAWSYVWQEAFSDASRTRLFSSTPTVAPGGKVYARVKARNIGTQTWSSSFLRLGTSRPMDRISQFQGEGWQGAARATQMLEATVAPGQVGTFEFVLTAPSTIGAYSEFFNLVADGRSWLNDLGLFFTVHVNTPIQPSGSNDSSLTPGEVLRSDEYLLSPEGHSALTMSAGGTVNLYSNFKSVWQTPNSQINGNRLVMQSDGNLVVYSSGGIPQWSSETPGNPGAWAQLQTDGNFVVYTQAGHPLWASNTTHNPDHQSYINTTMYSGILFPGQRIETINRSRKLFLQADGNLVLYSSGNPIWASGTNGKSVAFLALQPDGNLVLYNKQKQAVWSTRSAGTFGERLIVQADGNLVLYTRDGRPVWASGTSGR